MSPAEIIAEFDRDRPHVMHAIKKSYGGATRMEAALQRGRDESLRMREGEQFMDNVEPYTSGFTGNKWISYVYFRNAGFGRSYSGVRSFVYWYTDDGSIAACTLVAPFGRKALLMFSGHFFQRYAERENLGPVDLQLVIEFMLKKAAPLTKLEYEDNKDGVCRFDLVLPDGLGRGYTSHFDPYTEDPYVQHVRTYLPNRMLNNKQRQETAEARERYSRALRPSDAFVNAYVNDMPPKELFNLCYEIFAPFKLRENFGYTFYRILRHFFDIEVSAVSPSPATSGGFAPGPAASPAGNGGALAPTPSTAVPPAPNPQLRGILLSAYHKYSQAIFEFLDYRKSNTYTYEDIIKIGLIADPDFPVIPAIRYSISSGLKRLSFPPDEIEKRIARVEEYLSRPENKVTIQNIHNVFNNYK